MTIKRGEAKTTITGWVRQGVVWLPVRNLVQSLGGQVSWEGGTGTVIVQLGQDRLSLRLGEQRASHNDRSVTLLASPELIDGTTYVTWYDLHLYLSLHITWTIEAADEPQPLRGISICLDPGHGGIDYGATGPSNLPEKNVVLDVIRRLERYMAEAGAQVVLTRHDDIHRTLAFRSQLANDHKVDWFVSVHCNAFTNPSAHGTETFHYPSDRRGGELAQYVQQELIAKLGRFNRGVKTANFHVLRETQMPAILAELAFISNPEEEKLLAEPEFREKAARAIYEAFVRMVNNKS